jgi:replication factor A1
MVERILSQSNIGHDELMSRIHNKQKELGGFVTLEGAANIVARELGIVFEHKKPEPRPLYIEDLIPGMSKVDIVARVVRVHEPREFQRPNGTSGWVGGLLLKDATGQIRLTLWDGQTSLIKDGEVKKGDIVRVQNAYVRQGFDKQAELNLGTRGTVTLDPDDPRVAELPPPEEVTVRISDLTGEMAEVDIFGRAAAVSDCRAFERPDKTVGKVSTLMLTDSTGEVRVSLWDEWAELSKGLKRGEVVKLENAAVRLGPDGCIELSLDSRGRLILSPPGVELPKLAERPLRVKEIEADMRTLDLAARVKRILPPHEFRRGDGSTGRVASVILADETGTIRASFWGAAAELVQKLQPNDVVLLRNAYSRMGLGGRPEVHVGGTTRVEVNLPGVSVGEPRPSRTKIGELEPNMDALEVVGRVMEITRPREFTRSDGRRGKVASIVIGDKTGVTRVSFWHEQADRVQKMNVGDVLRLIDCYSTLGLFGQPELHLGAHGSVEINPAGEEVPPAEVLKAAMPEVQRLKVAEIDREGIRVQVRGTVIQVFHRRPIFDICPNCGRTLGSVDTSLLCEECGKVVTPEHRVVLSFLLDDGTDCIRVVLFGRVAEQLLGMDAQRVFGLFRSTPDLIEFYNMLKLVGKELVITGTIRHDKYFDQLEIRGTEVRIPDARQEARALLEKLKEKT